LIPRRPVRVEILRIDSANALGVLANISDLGACVWTQTAFSVGDAVVLRLAFDSDRQPFQAAGRVVWSDRPGAAGSLCRCALRWAHCDGPHYDALKRLIESC
jgi:Tfp pilus assembly protein PilZ